MANKTPPLSTFKEESFESLNHDLRVFIQGVEVTQDLLGSLNVHTGKNSDPNSVTFQLDNALDKYFITDTNLSDSSDPLSASFSDDAGRYSERAKRDIYKFKIIKKVQQSQSSSIRDVFNQVFSSKYTQSVQSSADTVQSTPNDQNAADTASMSALAAEVVANLDDIFFVNTGGPDSGNLVFSVGNDGSNPNLNSAQNTATQIAKQLEAQYPQLSSSDALDIAKGAVLARMKQVTGQVASPIRPKPNTINPQDPYTGVYRWEFHAGDCVLTQLDPIVVFATNPFAPDSSDQWMPVFTGFLTDLKQDRDHSNGESKLSVTGQDIRFLMAKMRVASNTITSVKTPELVYNEGIGIFNDLVGPTGGRTVQFSGKNFDDTVSWVLTGVSTVEAALKEQTTNRDLRGVGGLFMRQRVVYPPEGAAGPRYQSVDTGQQAKYAIPIPVEDRSGSSAKLLADWNTFALLGGQGNSSNASSYTGDFLTYAQCTAIGSTTHTGNPQNDPLNRGVNLLVPSEAGSKIANIVAFGIVKAGQESYNFRDRLDIFEKIVGTLNYVFYVAPHGDIMVEFPFYDFLVGDFGHWGDVFTFNKHVVSSSTVFEKPDITTGVVVTGGFAADLPEGSAPNNKIIDANNTVVISSPKLAARYGLKSENISFPYTRQKTDLAAYGMLKFQELLGNANALTVQTIFRPFLLPNRPILISPDSKMGLTVSVENTWTLFETCSTSYALSYIRTRHPVRVNPDALANPEFIDSWRFLTGGTIMGLSYRFAYGITGPVKPNDPFSDIAGNLRSGIRIYEDTGSSSGADVPNSGVPIPGGITDAQIATAREGKSSPSLEDLCTPDGKISGVSTSKLQASARSALQNIVREACVRMYVTSAVRTEAENAAAYGATKSAHLTGLAWDARIRDPATGRPVYTSEELSRIKSAAQKYKYTLLNETDHLHFEPHKEGTPWYRDLPTAAQRDQDKKIAEAKRLAKRQTA